MILATPKPLMMIFTIPAAVSVMTILRKEMIGPSKFLRRIVMGEVHQNRRENFLMMRMSAKVMEMRTMTSRSLLQVKITRRVRPLRCRRTTSTICLSMPVPIAASTIPGVSFSARARIVTNGSAMERVTLRLLLKEIRTARSFSSTDHILFGIWSRVITKK